MRKKIKKRNPREVYLLDRPIVGIVGSRVYAHPDVPLILNDDPSRFTVVKFREVL